MKIERVQKTLNWAIIISETSHIFCCILPTLFSVLSLIVGMGLITAMPVGIEVMHEALHDWEIPMILASGLVLVAGWIIYYIAKRLDCHDTGCVHEPCGPKKKKSGLVLKFATALFFFNVTVFLVFHHGMEHMF